MRRLPTARRHVGTIRPGKRARFRTIEPGTPGYPWNDLCLNPINFPTPGCFWDWGGGSWMQGVPSLDDVVRAYLGSALIMVDQDPELATHKSSQARRLRQQARSELLSSAWNLGLFACENANYCGGADPKRVGCLPGRTIIDKHMMNERGLGIHCYPYHDDIIRAIEDGRAPVRSIDMNGSRLMGILNIKMPVLWMVPNNPELLAASEPRFSSEGMTWDDGSPCSLPPPIVTNLEIQNPYALPGSPSWREIFGGR